MERRGQAHLIGPLALLGAIAFWGFVPVATRYLLAYFSPAQLLALRFGLGALFVVLILATLRPGLPSRRRLRQTIALGMFATLGYNVLLAFGIQRIEAGTAALLNGTQPVLIALLAAIVLGENLSRRMTIGALVALVGSALIALTAESGIQFTGSYVFGCVLVLLTSVVWATYSVIAKPRFGPEMPPSSVTLLGVLCAAPLIVPFGVAGTTDGLGELTWPGWLAIALLAVGANVTAPALFNIGLQRGQASNAGFMLFLVPLIGVVSSVALLDESLAPTHVVGGALIILGVAIATFSPTWLAMLHLRRVPNLAERPSADPAE